MGFYAVIHNAYKERGRPTKIHDSDMLLTLILLKNIWNKGPKNFEPRMQDVRNHLNVYHLTNKHGTSI